MSIVCINTNTSSFKQRAKEMNVSELVLHDATSTWFNVKNQTEEPTVEQLWDIISPKEVEVPNEDVLHMCKTGNIADLISTIKTAVGNNKGISLKEYQLKVGITISLELLQEVVPTLIHWKDNNNNVYINVGKPMLSYENELQYILDSAPRNEQGQLLAPNGKISNLTERQYAQVRTKAFIDWFGDWINDPKNASKIVDENGEPMVVYRANSWGKESTYDTFDENKGGNYRGFYFSNKEAVEHRYGKYLRAFFINSKNPFTENVFNILQEDKKELVNAGYDGMIFNPNNNIYNEDFELKVFNPNQIKSATDNIGTFSRESNNIYYNKTKELFDIIRKINWSEVLGKGLIEEHGLVYKEHNKYYITLGELFKLDVNFFGNELEKNITPRLLAYINSKLIEAGLNPNVVKINITNTGEVELQTADVISKNKKQLISTKSIETVLSFLEAKIPGLTHKVIKDNSPILRKLNIDPSANAFFNDGTVYLIEGKFNEDIAIEECLHPLVNAVSLKNQELFNQLVETAKTEFPTLYEEIKMSYEKESVDKELVTQALSRYTRKEFEEQKGERTKWEQLVDKFYSFIKDLFGVISIKNIKPTTTFKELSQIILSEDGYFNINLSGREYNKVFAQLDDISEVRTDDILNTTNVTIDEKPELTVDNIPQTIIDENGNTEEVLYQLDITSTNKTVNGYGIAYKVSVALLENEQSLLDELNISNQVKPRDLIILPDVTEQNIPLIAKLCASPYYNKSKQGTITIELTDENVIKAAKKHSRVLNYKRDNNDKVTITVPKSFIVGYTQEELDLYKNHEALMNITSIGPIQLKAFAKATMFLTSDYISRILEKDPDVIEELGITAKELEKCNSRIDVINTLGLGRILNHVKEIYFDNHQGDLTEACKEISDNWNAFVELGFLELMSLEKIALNQKETFSDTNIALDIFDTADEQEIQEIFGSSVETWLVGFRLMSVFSGLSLMIKLRLHSLIQAEKDQDGDIVPVLNELGMLTAVDATMATASILKWTRYSTSLDLMIDKLKKHTTEAPWLQPLIADLETTEDEQFKASFFTNFCKYFQSYTVNYIDKEGKAVSKVINENEYADTVLENLNSILEQDRSKLFLLNSADKVNTIGATKYYNIINALTKDNIDIDKIVEILKDCFNITFTGDKIALLEVLKQGHHFENFKKHMLAIVNDAKNVKEDKQAKYNPLTNNKNDYKNILSVINQVITTSIESVSYSDGKLHYSYVIPSYLNILVGKLQGNLHGLYQDAKDENDRYQKFLEDEFGQYSWFKSKRNGKWLNRWLLILATDSKAREIFNHTAVLTKDKVSYVNKNSPQYAASLIYLYFATGINSNMAWFRLPMMSNKPSEEYIKFYKTNINEIPNILANTVFIQELQRILGCKERVNTILNKDSGNYHPECGIKAFDKNGLKFQFLEYLQVFQDNAKYQTFINEITDESFKTTCETFKSLLDTYFKGGEFTDQQKAQLVKTVEEIIKYNMDLKFKNYIQSMKENGLLIEQQGKLKITDPALLKMDIFQTSDLIEKYLEEYFYNDVFATMLILQLTVTDKAFYKDDDDLQKRLAQLHAPVMRGYVQVKDFTPSTLNNQQGRVSDGVYRSIILKDDIVKSDILANLEQARHLILKDISDPVIKLKTEIFLKDAISAFETVNFADAQSFQTPTALRKKLHMFGKWSKEMEDAYNRIMSGAHYGQTDIDVLWQPLKPFVYGMKSQNSYSSMGAIRSGVLFKNSEYTLIMADAILRMAHMPNKLQAIYDVLEATHHTKNADNTINMLQRTDNGIDSCLFESTFKAGLTGIIDITDSAIDKFIKQNSEETEAIKQMLLEANAWLANNEMLLNSYLKTEITKRILQNAIYNNSKASQSGYNTDYVQEISFDCYGLQQEVPSHFRHEQLMGSQMRILAISDTPNMNHVTNQPNMVTINGLVMEVEKAKQEYMATIARNIDICRQELTDELNLTTANQELKDLALSRLLRKTILEDGRYGADALWGVTINPKTGTFNRPLSDPTQLDMIEKMLNSIIKNRIHKQKIAGGPVVQVTSFGTSDELHIRYKSADNKILFTEKEFNALKGLKRINRENAEKVIAQRVARHLDDYCWDNKIQTYKLYVQEFQHSPAYYECYSPIYADWLRDPQFLDRNGNIDIDKVAAANPKALQMIGYRIPTEAKYSMCPIKIVGFLPITAGEGIMMPKELTTLSGSDKMRHCFYHYNIKNPFNCWKL